MSVVTAGQLRVLSAMATLQDKLRRCPTLHDVGYMLGIREVVVREHQIKLVALGLADEVPMGTSRYARRIINRAGREALGRTPLQRLDAAWLDASKEERWIFKTGLGR